MVIKSENNAELNTLINVAFHTILTGSSDMIFVKDANLVYVAASEPFVKMVGKKSVEEIINKNDLELFDDESLARRYIADDMKLLEEGKNLIDYIEPITEENGHARYGSTSKYILYGNDGKVIGILGITKDITRDYIVRQHYQQELKYLFELPNDILAVTYIDVNSWRIISQRRQSINGGTMQSCYTIEELCSAAVESIVDSECDAAEFYSHFTQSLLKDIYGSGRSNLSYTYQRCLSDGSLRWVRNDVKFMIDVDNGHLCAMLSAKDISAEKNKEQKLVVAAKMDKMTMLLNRETTMESIKKTLVDESERTHALFMIDIDNFKSLNDTLGHQAGDEFLIALAVEISKSFCETDIVGRIGGDEFFVLMRNVSEISQATKKAQELLEAIHKVCVDYSNVNLSASVGISVYPGNGRTLKELYGKADEALYQAKRKGKNQYIFA